MLMLEIKELELEGLTLGLTGFDAEELEALTPVEVIDGLVDEDATPKVPAEAITKPGDVWLLGKHRLMSWG